MRVRNGALGGTWAVVAVAVGAPISGAGGGVKGEEGRDVEREGCAGLGDVSSMPRKVSKACMSELCAALGPDSSVGTRSPVPPRPSNAHFFEPESAPLNQGLIT